MFILQGNAYTGAVDLICLHGWSPQSHFSFKLMETLRIFRLDFGLKQCVIVFPLGG